jgi:hypothetical protein
VWLAEPALERGVELGVAAVAHVETAPVIRTVQQA